MQTSFDAIDRKILDQLRIDGRMPFAEIAKKVNVSEASVRARYQRLRDRGLMQIVAIPDPVLLGSLETHLALQVRGVPLEAVVRTLSTIPEVRYIASGLGSYDLIVDLYALSSRAMADAVIDKIRRLNGVETVDTMAVHETVKDSYVWEAALEPRT